MSPDPLLNSGRPDNPQTWNRYAYTLNNPLRYVDPTGFWEWEASGCQIGDKNCEDEYKKNQKLFKDSLSYLKMSRDFFKKGSLEYNRINDALAAYGQEGDGGIGVGFGILPGDTAAQTDGSLVTFDMSKFNRSDTAKWMAVETGHEGTHVSDIAAGGARSLSPFSFEFRGYQTSAFVFQGLFTPRNSGSSAGMSMGGVTAIELKYKPYPAIWNTSWGAADAPKLRDFGITNTVIGRHEYEATELPESWRGK